MDKTRAGYPFFTEVNDSRGAPGAPSAERVAFLAATDFESRCIERGLQASFESGVPATAAVCLSCGIGCRNDGVLRSLERYRCVISAGFAAGLRESAKAGMLLLPRRIHKDAAKAFAADPEWHAKLSAAVADPAPAGAPVSTQAIVHTGRIAATPADKRALARGGEFAGADMESALIAAACDAAQVPFVALRVVLDPVDVTVPDTVLAVAERAAKPHPAALLSELSRRPRDLPGLYRFLRLTMVARQVLTHTITRVMAGSAHGATVER